MPPSSINADPRLKVAVVGYDPLRLVGLRAVLESEDEFAVHEVEPEDLARPLPGDLVLIGPHGLPSVFDAIAAIRSLRPEVKIILTSASTSDETMLRAVSAGEGLSRRSGAGGGLHEGSGVVSEGSMWAPRRILAKFIERVIADPKKATSHSLSDRERQVLELLVAGRTNKEIGRELGIEERTVKLHVSKLMQKAGVDNRIALSVHAVTNFFFSAG